MRYQEEEADPMGRIPYNYGSLCRGGVADELSKLLAVRRNKLFAVMRFDPAENCPEMAFGELHQEIIPALAARENLGLRIERLVDLHLYTSWDYPVIYILAARSKTELDQKLTALQEILGNCLDGGFETFCRLQKERGRDLYPVDAITNALKRARESGFRLAPCLGPIFYSRREVKTILALFVTPHGELSTGPCED